jgi:hypothetical protein
MKDLLEDDELAVREATALIYEKLSMNDDGVQRVVASESPGEMAKSFILHSSEEGVQKEDAQYLIHLLEAFCNITFSDLGVEPLLQIGLIEQFGKILDGGYIQSILEDKYEKIAELSLRVLGNMSINHQGKEECITHKIILRSYTFIEDDHSYND